MFLFLVTRTGRVAPLYGPHGGLVLSSHTPSAPRDSAEALAAALYPGDLEQETDEPAKALEQGQEMSQAEDETKSRVGDFVMRAAFNRYAALEWRRARDRAYAEELLAVHCDQAPDGTHVVRKPKQFMRAVKLEKKAKAFIAANHNQWASIEFLHEAEHDLRRSQHRSRPASRPQAWLPPTGRGAR